MDNRLRVLLIVLTLIISFRSIAFATNDLAEYNEEPDMPIAISIYTNPHSQAYIQLAHGEPMFENILPAGEASYKILPYIDDLSVELLSMEIFEPYGYNFIRSISAEIKLKKDTIYEVPISKPEINGSMIYSNALRIATLDGSELVELIPYDLSGVNDEIIVYAYSYGEGDANIISDGDRTLDLLKVRVGGLPTEGVSVHDASYIWASLTLALQHTIDRNYPVSREHSFNPKGKTSIPGWIVRGGMMSMYPDIDELPVLPSEVSYDEKDDLYLIDADALIKRCINFDDKEVKILRIGSAPTDQTSYITPDEWNTVYIRSHNKTMRAIMRESSWYDYYGYGSGKTPFRFVIVEIDD